MLGSEAGEADPEGSGVGSAVVAIVATAGAASAAAASAILRRAADRVAGGDWARSAAAAGGVFRLPLVTSGSKSIGTDRVATARGADGGDGVGGGRPCPPAIHATMAVSPDERGGDASCGAGKSFTTRRRARDAVDRRRARDAVGAGDPDRDRCLRLDTVRARPRGAVTDGTGADAGVSDGFVDAAALARATTERVCGPRAGVRAAALRADADSFAARGGWRRKGCGASFRSFRRSIASSFLAARRLTRHSQRRPGRCHQHAVRFLVFTIAVWVLRF